MISMHSKLCAILQVRSLNFNWKKNKIKNDEVLVVYHVTRMVKLSMYINTCVFICKYWLLLYMVDLAIFFCIGIINPLISE